MTLLEWRVHCEGERKTLLEKQQKSDCCTWESKAKGIGLLPAAMGDQERFLEEGGTGEDKILGRQMSTENKSRAWQGGRETNVKRPVWRVIIWV